MDPLTAPTRRPGEMHVAAMVEGRPEPPVDALAAPPVELRPGDIVQLHRTGLAWRRGMAGEVIDWNGSGAILVTTGGRLARLSPSEAGEVPVLEHGSGIAPERLVLSARAPTADQAWALLVRDDATCRALGYTMVERRWATGHALGRRFFVAMLLTAGLFVIVAFLFLLMSPPSGMLRITYRRSLGIR